MNILSGIAKGIRLEVPKGFAIRPTAVMARKSIFDSIRVFEKLTVVDLFSGAGSLGLEAASRGASCVYFFENSKTHCEILKTNIDKVAKAGVSATLKVFKSDALKSYENLPEIEGKIDLIFADPPYNESADVVKTLLTDRAYARWASGALFVMEIPSELNRKPKLENIDLWTVTNTRKIGQSIFVFLKVANLEGIN